MANSSIKSRSLRRVDLPNIRRALLQWFTAHRRDLPWRRTRDPYRILLSEIMLQQTQVDRVLPKYRAFLRRFPTIARLARARPGSVIRAWAGLGYNNRAVRLHQAARRVIRTHGGVFPRTFDALCALPGVGAYTARAILTFSFGARVAAVDVNHGRIVQRVFFGMQRQTTATLQQSAVSLLPKREVSAWNQAMMDFGALVCRSVPRCNVCPIRTHCRAYPAILGADRHRRRTVEPFVGSDRYFRGRIVHVLRGIPRGASITLRELWQCVHALHPVLPARHHALVTALARDGVLRIVTRNQRRVVRLA